MTLSRRAAHHAAGHAIAEHLQGHRLRSVTIDCIDDDSVCRHGCRCVSWWPWTWRRQRTAFTTMWAGVVAEARFIHDDPCATAVRECDDRLMGRGRGELGHFLAHVTARALLEWSDRSFDALVEALMERGRLSGREVHRILSDPLLWLVWAQKRAKR